MVTLLRTARTLTTPTCRRTTSLMWSRQRSASARATCKFILYVRSISTIDLFPHFFNFLVILPLIHHPSFCHLCCPYICICKMIYLSLYGKLYYIPSYWKCKLSYAPHVSCPSIGWPVGWSVICHNFLYHRNNCYILICLGAITKFPIRQTTLTPHPLLLVGKYFL